MVAVTIAQNLGIMVSCVPYLKPFLDSLESGLIRSDDIRRRAGATSKSTSGYAKTLEEAATTPSQPRPDHTDWHELREVRPDGTAVVASITAGNKNTGDWETLSHSSQVKLIKQVKTWGVTTAPAGGSESAASGGD